MTDNSTLEQQIAELSAMMSGENQEESNFLASYSKPFQILDKQIAAWNAFISSDSLYVGHEDATLFAFLTSEYYLSYILKSTELEQLRYYYIAQRISDLFWQHNRAHRGKDSPGYPGHFGCRVRLRDKKLEMFWFYNEFKQKKGTVGFNVISHYLPRECGYCYSKTTFSRAQDWEKPVIEIVENSFAVIRRANANLIRIRQLCRWNDNNLYQMAGRIQEFKEGNPLI
ncbi:hypothetical protein JYB88_18325 [Shewanella cyperi]|uniref:Uncharacterized protein n=1 Tax=Shewanella cyperi TaxID=2814292 RepID=A0A974XMR7_9GAMM|nr:conjugative transfer protein MobI(A/C) [Shewanella cyperi]QSX30098.1 hypothetical protein JYB88_18325 [Shewanella cyperi]